jgi:hypothetical protein
MDLVYEKPEQAQERTWQVRTWQTVVARRIAVGMMLSETLMQTGRL